MKRIFFIALIGVAVLMLFPMPVFINSYPAVLFPERCSSLPTGIILTSEKDCLNKRTQYAIDNVKTSMEFHVPILLKTTDKQLFNDIVGIKSDDMGIAMDMERNGLLRTERYGLSPKISLAIPFVMSLTAVLFISKKLKNSKK